MNEKSLHHVLIDFLHKIESLNETMPLLLVMMYVSKKVTRSQHAKFLREHGEVIEENESIRKYRLSMENERMVARLQRKHERAKTASDLLPSKLLISYVSEYDAFLGSFMKKLIELKPELINFHEKNIQFSVLLSLGSVDSVFKSILDKEVESVLRSSHADHFKWLEKICNIPLTKNLESWKFFIELTERRNLFVHCDGIVSDQYLSVCKNFKIELGKNIKNGDQLKVDKKYLDEVYECLYEISVKLTQVIWRKIFPNEIEFSDESLIEVSFSLIQEGKFALAQKILDFAALSIKRFANDSNRRILIVNRAQAYFHGGDKKLAHEILDAEDWSSCADNFKICVEVIYEKYEVASNLMKRIGRSGDLSEADYLDWPVFMEFRKSEIFNKTFEEVFGKLPVNTSELVKGVESEGALHGFMDEIINDIKSEVQ